MADNFFNSFGSTVYQYATPTTGTTVSINSTARTLIVDPAGTLLALTVNLPSSPADGKIITIGSSQAITTLTLGGGTIVGTLTSFSAGSFATYLYKLSNTTWYRIG